MTNAPAPPRRPGPASRPWPGSESPRASPTTTRMRLVQPDVPTLGGARNRRCHPVPAAPRSRSNAAAARTASDRTPRPPCTVRCHLACHRRARTRRLRARGARRRPVRHVEERDQGVRAARFRLAAGYRHPIRIETIPIRTTRGRTETRKRTDRAAIRTVRWDPGPIRPMRIRPARTHRVRIRPAHIRRARHRVSRRGRSVGRHTRPCRRRHAPVDRTRPARTAAARRVVRRTRRDPVGRIRNRVRLGHIGRPVARPHRRTASCPTRSSPVGVRRVNPADPRCRSYHRLR